jgi:hypothetical protein
MTWAPPFRDAVDVIIEKVLDPNTIAPINGFTDAELLKQVNLQNEIMDTHEDYAALRGKGKGVSMRDKKQLAEDEKGISKLVTEPYYPTRGALMLSSEFIPDWVFMNPDVVEYNNDGKVSYVTDSPSYLKQQQEMHDQSLQKQQVVPQQTVVPVQTAAKGKIWA